MSRLQKTPRLDSCFTGFLCAVDGFCCVHGFHRILDAHIGFLYVSLAVGFFGQETAHSLGAPNQLEVVVKIVITGSCDEMLLQYSFFYPRDQDDVFS